MERKSRNPGLVADGELAPGQQRLRFARRFQRMEGQRRNGLHLLFLLRRGEEYGVILWISSWTQLALDSATM